MIYRRIESEWDGVAATAYKNEPGTWQDVTRRVLAEGAATGFEVRYFELAPGGYSSFERHEHEHVVVVVSGAGQVRLGDEWNAIGPLDVVRVASGTPHQFKNESGAPFGILCIVDRDRDKPILLDPDGSPRASNE